MACALQIRICGATGTVVRVCRPQSPTPRGHQLIVQRKTERITAMRSRCMDIHIGDPSARTEVRCAPFHLRRLLTHNMRIRYQLSCARAACLQCGRFARHPRWHLRASPGNGYSQLVRCTYDSYCDPLWITAFMVPGDAVSKDSCTTYLVSHLCTLLAQHVNKASSRDQSGVPWTWIAPNSATIGAACFARNGLQSTCPVHTRSPTAIPCG